MSEVMDKPDLIAREAAIALPDEVDPRVLEGGCSSGDELAKAKRKPASPSSWSATPQDYPKGPHDQPQSMCPAFGSLRVGLRMRRTATVLSGLGLLRLRPDLHLALLRCAAHRRLRAVQLGDARHRQAVRGHSRCGLRAADPETTTRSWSPTSACRPLRACRCDCSPNEINGVRIIGIDVPGLRRADARRGQGRAGRRHARLRPQGSGAGPCWRRAGGHRTADRDAARRDVSGRSGHHRPCCSSRWASPRARLCRPASGVSSTALDCAASPRSIPSTRRPFREFEAQGAHRRFGPGRRRRHGRLARAIGEAAGACRQDRGRTERNSARHQGRARGPSRSRDASPFPATRAPSCSSRAC
jgi:chlorophyllide a reductase subunit Y